MIIHLPPISNLLLKSHQWLIIFLWIIFSHYSPIKAATIPIQSIISVTSLDTEGCCFELNYFYDNALGNIDALETRILTPNVLFSNVQFPLTSGWSYDEILAKRRLRWSHNDDGIPLGEQTLAELCFSGWDTSNPVELLVIWRQGNVIRQRDTIKIECSQCWQAQNPIVTCEPDSSYTYTFDYVNLSEFQVDYLQIRELNDQNLIIEQNIPLPQSLLPGEIAAALQLQIRPEALGMDKVCFEITPHHFFQDSLVVECCTAEYCIDIPVCDRCCTSYSVFEEEVEQGFNIVINCEAMSVRLQANALNECDQVHFEIAGLGAGIVEGNESVIFGGLNENEDYDVCMSVIRQDMTGENCYEETSLQICDQFVFDCITESLQTTTFLDGGKIYPNPVNQLLKIELPSQNQQVFEVWNSVGQRILQSQTDYLGKAEILTHQWPAGYYYVTAYIGSHSLWRKSFIVDHW